MLGRSHGGESLAPSAMLECIKIGQGILGIGQRVDVADCRCQQFGILSVRVVHAANPETQDISAAAGRRVQDQADV